jgi:hypothetical protein
MMATHTMKDLRLLTSEATAKAWGLVERSAMVFLGGLAPAVMGNLREVFTMSTAETSMIADCPPRAATTPTPAPPGAPGAGQVPAQARQGGRYPVPPGPDLG